MKNLKMLAGISVIFIMFAAVATNSTASSDAAMTQARQLVSQARQDSAAQSACPPFELHCVNQATKAEYNAPFIARYTVAMHPPICSIQNAFDTQGHHVRVSLSVDQINSAKLVFGTDVDGQQATLDDLSHSTDGISVGDTVVKCNLMSTDVPAQCQGECP